MNPIQSIIQDIKFHIPHEILMAAFYRREFGQNLTPINIDDVIRETVIENKVRKDCDLVGGTEILIPISDLQMDQWDAYRYVFRVPRERTNGRNITRLVGVVLGNYMYAGSYNYGALGGAVSQPLSLSSSAVASLSAIPYTATTDIQLIGPNTVLISDVVNTTTNLHLRCFVENDADFSNLRPTVIHRFSEMCLLAVKAFIYNQLKIRIDMGELVGGMNLGAFKEIVDEYRDAGQLYQDFLVNKWRKLALLSDPMFRKRHVRLLFGAER